MFIQMFRNRISQSSQLKKRIGNLESVIRSNLTQIETKIVEELTEEWNEIGRVALKPFVLGVNSYSLWIDFYQLKTHGLSIEVKDNVQLDSDKLEFPTEYGDIAVIVDYFFQQKHISGKVSILQTKKERRPGEVDIALHQLYLMQSWPCVEFPSGTKYEFEGINADEFSFYHFVLNHSANSQFCSSLCSAPFVGHLLGCTKAHLQKQLKIWKTRRKTYPKLKPPSQKLHRNLLPGAIDTNKYSPQFNWQLIPKSFDRFLLDAAHLFVGTSHKDILALTRARIPIILGMRVVGGREREDINPEEYWNVT